MSLQSIIKTDLKFIEGELSNPTITWKNEDYICIPSSEGATSLIGEGGFSIDADVVMSVRKELFTDGIFPKQQEKFTYQGKMYRVLTIREDVTGAFLRVFGVDPNRV